MDLKSGLVLSLIASESRPEGLNNIQAYSQKSDKKCFTDQTSV